MASRKIYMRGLRSSSQIRTRFGMVARKGTYYLKMSLEDTMDRDVEKVTKALKKRVN